MRVAVAASCLLAFAGLSSTASAASLWHDQALESFTLAGPRLITPLKARTVEIDLAGLSQVLDAIPADGDTKARPTLNLPMPDGKSLEFRLTATQVMHPDLAARYPAIRTFAGEATDGSGATGRFDVGPRGLHGMVFLRRGTVYIDPLSRGDTAHYQVYFTRDMAPRQLAPDIVIRPQEHAAIAPAGAKAAAIGGELRTYRLALAADGQYSRFQDPPTSPIDQPDKAIVLAEIVNLVNRVSGVYERELGIRLQLVANEDKIIFTNRAADPYIDRSPTEMLLMNTRVINFRIGKDNYDIGHVSSTGGGGVAYLGVVCNEQQKGGGVTGLPTPVGDPYYIDFVAHEMGHQHGGDHTFNSESGNCGGGNRNGPTAYEPGSGVTIMGYAGICAEDDLAPHSIDTFHAGSFDEIVAYTRNGGGATCGTVTPTTNHAPVVDAGTGGFTIPKGTPFELTGSATDIDGDALTYQWEQFDLGAGGLADAPDASAPLFRSFTPTASPTRVFPRPADLLNNTHTIGELLPQVSRSLHFRLTVRDNRVAPEAGGVASADLQFNVDGASGPFAVLQPNDPSMTLQGRQALDVFWSVAGTSSTPVNCANVDILFSSDGGQNFPTALASAVPNSGVLRVTVPNVDTSSGRVKVKCSDNVFFDVSDHDFSVVALQDPAPFSFADTKGAPGDAVIRSSEITVSGITQAVAITVAGQSAAYQVNDGAFTRDAGTVVNGDRVRLRMRTPALGELSRVATLNVGGVIGTWTVTTGIGSDTAADPLPFVNQASTPGQYSFSNEVIVTGIDAPAPISISGASAHYQVNHGAYTTAPGTVHVGDKVRIRMYAPLAGKSRSAMVTIGGVPSNWTLTSP